MRFKSYIPALYVLTTQLDSLSKPSRPHKIMNIFFVIFWAFRSSFRPFDKLRAQDVAAGYSLQSFCSYFTKRISAAIPNATTIYFKYSTQNFKE